MNENDFEWIDFAVRQKEQGEFALTISKFSTYFRIGIKNIILEKGLTHVRMRKDKYTDRIWFVFNKTGEGLRLNSLKTKQNLSIHNKGLAEFLLCTYDKKRI